MPHGKSSKASLTLQGGGDKGFTPWHTIWRANQGRTRDSVREDAWMRFRRSVRIHLVAKILKCLKIYFQGVMT